MREQDRRQCFPAGLDVIRQPFRCNAVPEQVNQDHAVRIGKQITVYTRLYPCVALDGDHYASFPTLWSSLSRSG
jgi:hypothetical protein